MLALHRTIIPSEGCVSREIESFEDGSFTRAGFGGYLFCKFGTRGVEGTHATLPNTVLTMKRHTSFWSKQRLIPSLLQVTATPEILETGKEDQSTRIVWFP